MANIARVFCFVLAFKTLQQNQPILNHMTAKVDSLIPLIEIRD